MYATIHHFPSFEPMRLQAFPASHLSLPTRHDILHRAVVFEGDNTRRGTASTKWRDEIHKSARKVRPQKGSGRARLGDNKSPMLRGGGVAFGPKPRDFSTELQRKVYDLAFRTALSYRYKMGQLIVVGNALEIASPSTTLLAQILRNSSWNSIGEGGLFITAEDRPFLATALERAPRWGWAATWDDVDVKDLLKGPGIVIERGALRNILNAHSSDLTTSEKPSPSQKAHQLEELQRLVGWNEFRELELARLDEEVPPEDLVALEAEVYHKAASKIFKKATSKSQEQPEILFQSARVLRWKGYEAQAKTVDVHDRYTRQAAEKEADAEQLDANSPEFEALMCDAALLRAEAAEYRMMKIEYLARGDFTRADLLDADGLSEEAAEARQDAEDGLAQADDIRSEIMDLIEGQDFSTEEKIAQSTEIYDRATKAREEFAAREESFEELGDDIVQDAAKR